MQALSTRLIRAALFRRNPHPNYRVCPTGQRTFTRAHVLSSPLSSIKLPKDSDDSVLNGHGDMARPEHAVISTFDLFSIGGE